MLNLVANAMKFTDRDGEIFIVVKYMDKRTLLLDNDYLEISVIDNGIGIKKKNQGKLFQLFGSIKNEKHKFNIQGIGLGLIISKMIVNKFGGQIDFVSKYKKGTTFFYTFLVDKVTQEMVIEHVNKANQKKIRNNRPTNLSNVAENMSDILEGQEERILVADDEEFCIASMEIMM